MSTPFIPLEEWYEPPKHEPPRMPGVGSQERQVLAFLADGKTTTADLCGLPFPHYTRAITQLRKDGWKIKAVPKPSRKNWTYRLDGRQLRRLRRLMKEGT